MNTWVFAAFLLLAGGYLLICGIAGKGEIYKNANIKEGYDQKYKSLTRIFLLILGMFMVIMGLMELLGYLSVIVYTRQLQIVLLCVCIVIIAAMLIIMKKLTVSKKPTENTELDAANNKSDYKMDINAEKGNNQ